MKSAFISFIFAGCMCAMLAYPAEQAPNPHSKPRYSSLCSAEYICPVGFECIITGDSIIYEGQGKCVPYDTNATSQEVSPTDTGDVTDTTFSLTSNSSTTANNELSETTATSTAHIATTTTSTEIEGKPTSSADPSSNTSETTTKSTELAVERTPTSDLRSSTSETTGTSTEPAIEPTPTSDPSSSSSETISGRSPAPMPPCKIPSFDYTHCTDGGAFEILRIGPNTALQRCFATNTICERQANNLCGFSLGPNFISECVLNSANGF